MTTYFKLFDIYLTFCPPFASEKTLNDTVMIGFHWKYKTIVLDTTRDAGKKHLWLEAHRGQNDFQQQNVCTKT